ncbi:MAG TPA: TAT-variant-translocated molybdopterin oxidoreductase [Gammaproteobacteria bacterium]|nr:TAT-variant-translocated molybdopterin oxidoreductase [Gammaproteobacteria bacterium]
MQKIGRQLANRHGKEYWRSLEALAEQPAFGAYLEQEFPRLAEIWNGPVDRRGFLKISAAAMALAGLAGCERQPPEYIVPYVRMPERLVPGKPLFYATTLSATGTGVGALVETHEGRPLRLSGNPAHPASLGALDVFNQAAILDLYDPDRAQTPLFGGEPAAYSRFEAEWRSRYTQLTRQRGRGLHVLTPPLHSPSLAAQLQALLAALPEARWYGHTPLERGGALAGARQAFGQPLEVRYMLERAVCIVSLEADFLGDMPGSLRYARDYSGSRGVHGKRQDSRLYVIESQVSITGAKADHRQPVPPSQLDPVARALAARLGLPVSPPVEQPVPDYWLAALARDLLTRQGQSVVIAGEQQTAAVHLLAHAMNARLGNLGRTIEYYQPPLPSPAQDLAELLAAIAAGEVETLLILGGNPVYDAPADLDLATALPQVPFAVYYGPYANETAAVCRWLVPAAHPLESWGDALAFDGSASPAQPVVQPIYGGIEPLRFLAELRGQLGAQPRQLVRDYWQSRYGDADFDAWWNGSLHDGVFAGMRASAVAAELRPDWNKALPPLPQRQGMELRFAPDPSLWDGSVANNAWLQELPRPLTKLVWGNAVLINPLDAAAAGIAQNQLVQLAHGTWSQQVPAQLQPGQPRGTVTLHLGGGRSAAGRVGNGIGVAAYRLRPAAQPWFTTVQLQPLPAEQQVITTQHHHRMQGREQQLARTTTLQELTAEAARAAEPQPSSSLYPEHRYNGYAWGMLIDIDACIGCNACVIACQSENNVPSVGPEQVRRGREMHWLRIDQYYKGGLEAPKVVFQPVPCMHCEKAPCEYVCPMHATTHSSEGVNEMTYNRCIGTRDCSQNCPYKVRRFNFLSYTGKDALTPAVIGTHNPDVTVRSRGVMEKCSYCIQRINRARMAAQKENRRIRDGEFTTACAEACPTRAIVFGDINDPAAEVSQLKSSRLNYAMLAELNTWPRTTYLPGVRNPNPEIARHEGQ